MAAFFLFGLGIEREDCRNGAVFYDIFYLLHEFKDKKLLILISCSTFAIGYKKNPDSSPASEKLGEERPGL